MAFVKAKAKRDEVRLNEEEWTIEDESNSPQQTKCIRRILDRDANEIVSSVMDLSLIFKPG